MNRKQHTLNTQCHVQGPMSSSTAVQAEQWRADPSSGVWVEHAGLRGALDCVLRFVAGVAGNKSAE